MAAIAYIDESGDHNLTNISPHSPVFTVAAVILREDDIPPFETRLKELKVAHFVSEQVILHSRDIRKQENDFHCLHDPDKREAFYTAFNKLVTETSCTVISISIEKERLLRRNSPPITPYQLALEFLLERITHWSRYFHNFGPIDLIAESIGRNEDKQFKEFYNHFRTVGTRYEKPEYIQLACHSMRTESKALNIPGLQLADMIAYPLACHAIGRADPRTMAIIMPKLYGGLTGNIEKWGVKVFPPAPHVPTR